MTFAVATKVAPEKTRAEIERLVTNHGATKFVSGWEEDSAAILFEMKSRRIRFSLPMPDRRDKRFTAGRNAWTPRPASEQQRLYDQAIRTAWRGLLLVIKAKLEAVAAGIAVFEDEFLANIVIPGEGQTFGEWARPRIAEAYDRGAAMPPLLPCGPEVQK